jgi:hypothetical protein
VFRGGMDAQTWLAVFELTCCDWGVFKEFCWEVASALSIASRDGSVARKRRCNKLHDSSGLQDGLRSRIVSAALKSFPARYTGPTVGHANADCDALLLMRWLYGGVQLCET